jgi:1,2-diacylglycerol 3-alpha-glucosyltransferase
VLKTKETPALAGSFAPKSSCQVAVLWIDWYAYHLARFAALCEQPELKGSVVGLEMVGGTGVHTGLKFREEVPESMPVITLFPQGDWGRISKWKLASAIWKHLNRLNPSTVFVPGYYTLPALAAALWSKGKRRRSVLMTESTEADHQRTWWRELLKKILIRSLFDWAIAGGKAHRRYLEKLGFRPERIARFYDIVDNYLFRSRTQAERIRSRAHDFGLPDHFFLFVGRLAEEKNVDGLLAAYLNYRHGGGTKSLVFVGGGPLEGRLRQMVSESAFAPDIYFEGLKNSKELSPYYAFADCFVLPSTREPWGLVVNEAMAAGLPVLVSKACGCAEDLVIEGGNGFSFDPANRQELVDRLHAVENLSAAESRAMGRHSWEVISHYSPEAWAGEVARIARA